MTAPSISVVDYGVGNLYSVCRALEHCGGRVALVSRAEEVLAADRLLLPGVGAFADGMAGLRERELVEPIQRFARAGRPLLGICLGMQMLATVSEEFGLHDGLGLIPGRVVPVANMTVGGSRQKIPHVGWSDLAPVGDSAWRGSPLDGLPVGTPVYLVHSYHVVPDDPSNRLAECSYGGRSITAAIRAAQVIGLQFHPEKSGAAGLRILSRFLET